MWILVIGLISLGIVALLIGVAREKNLARKGIARDKSHDDTAIPDGTCCGQHAVCERDSLLAGVSKGIEYYDDEELDAYKGTHSNQYTDEQTEEFREIFYTMNANDVPGWCRSLQLRGVELPDQLKDEVLLVVGERRMKQTTNA